MKRIVMPVALAAALVAGGLALTVTDMGSTVLAQKAKTKKDGKDLRALKKEMAADNLKKIEKYIKDNPKADDIAEAHVLGIEYSGTAGDLKSGKKLAEAFEKDNAKHAKIGSVLIAYANLATSKGEAKDAAAAVEKAAKHADTRGAVDLYESLSLSWVIAGDMEKAKGCYDKILQLEEISSSAPNREHFEKKKSELDEVGKEFDHFEVSGFDSKPLSSKDYKGKYLFIDFWATWCGPCVREMPNVIENYNRWHESGFDVVGISLDIADKDGATKLREYVEKNKLPWRQYYDGKHWNTELFVKYKGTYGFNGIPATILLDKEGKVLAVGLRGEALSNVLERLLGDE